MLAAKQFGFHLNIACPEGYEPKEFCQVLTQGCFSIFRNPNEAVQNSDLIVTDVWASMGQEEEQALREKAFKGFQVNPELMAKANNNALFMHCLPAHEGEEISKGMLDHPQSVVWQEAENRMHAQKALMEFLLKQSQE